MRKRAQVASPRPLPELERLSFVLRQEVLTMIWQAGSGHPAGSLSCLDILIALYFGGILRYDPTNPSWPGRDFFLLSAGHYCPALYAVLSRAGFFSPAKLNSLRKLGSPFQGHPEKGRLPGVEISAGLLGQGLSVAVGLALAKVTDQRRHVFVLLSDAEHQEGQIWEAVMSAAKYRLGNLIAIVDRNQIQIDGKTKEIMPVDPLLLKYRSFGWRALEAPGHDFRRLLTAFHQAKEERRRPVVVIVHTVAGKGVYFMEDKFEWHGKKLSKKEWQQAMVSLDKNAKKI